MHMMRVMRNPVFGFPTRSDTNRAVQPQKMARGLQIGIQKEANSEKVSCAVTAKLICTFLFSHMQKAGFLMMRLIWLRFHKLISKSLMRFMLLFLSVNHEYGETKAIFCLALVAMIKQK